VRKKKLSGTGMQVSRFLLKIRGGEGGGGGSGGEKLLGEAPQRHVKGRTIPAAGVLMPNTSKTWRKNGGKKVDPQGRCSFAASVDRLRGESAPILQAERRKRRKKGKRGNRGGKIAEKERATLTRKVFF